MKFAAAQTILLNIRALRRLLIGMNPHTYHMVVEGQRMCSYIHNNVIYVTYICMHIKRLPRLYGYFCFTFIFGYSIVCHLHDTQPNKGVER